MAAPASALVTEHPQSPADDRCPLCNQLLPHDLSAKDLQHRLEEKQRQAAQVEAMRLRTEFAQHQAAAIEVARKEMVAQHLEREKVIRAEAKGQAEVALKNQIQVALADKAKAEDEKRRLEQLTLQLKAAQEETIKLETGKALRKQREVLQKDNESAMRRAQSQAFDKHQKLQKQVDALKRQLDEKSTAELGEGAEIDLYETLKDHFQGDKIRRIKKGQPGADIQHDVMHGGQPCGAILYDSKNHKNWRNDFVQKLKSDQLAAKADHAILTTSAFPAGEQQLCVKGDVIVTNPARVIELVGLVRGHIVRTHRLRLGAKEREKKTEALYEFINSGRCQQLMARYESITDSLLELDAKEVEGHQRTWEKRGRLIRDAQKAHGDLKAEIDRIIGGGAA